MISDEKSGNRLVGTYRGIVLKHLPHGRCKIFIPSVYDSSLSVDPDLLPSAQPKTPLFAGTNLGNGLFSYPNLSSIVWCTFQNGDANFPLFDSATLGGENAFGQYDLIKKKEEDVSERHLITSGKTHMMWYENGKISAIVEDPIRTYCSVDFDQFELEDNNTSVTNKYNYKITNPVNEKIAKNEISNINCQYVLDNNGEAHGVLSTSTHWYDIINVNLSAEQITKKGVISTDNRNVMDNNGVIDIGTISSYQVFVTDKKNASTDNSKEKVCNTIKMKVPGVLDTSLWNNEIKETKSLEKIEMTKLDSGTYSHQDISSDIELYSLRSETQSLQDIKKLQTINLTADLENRFSMQAPGNLSLSSEKHETVISADKNTNRAYTKKEDLTADIATSTNATTQLQNISSLNLVDTTNGSGIVQQVQLTNLYEMGNAGVIDIKTSYVENTVKTAEATETIRDNSYSSIEIDRQGNQTAKSVKYNFHSVDDSTTELDNMSVIAMENEKDAALKIRSIGKKKINGSPIVDTEFSNIINTTTSTANIQIVDNIVQKECVNNMNAKSGQIEIRITSKTNGMHCTIRLDAMGKMTIDTTDQLTVTTTNSVNMTSPAINLNGATTINGTLHVTGSTTIDPDATIGGKSFLGHKHTGNMGSPTSPPL